MFKRHKDAGWIMYSVACLIFWIWHFTPHEIPRTQFASNMYVLFGGGGFALFGFFGAILGEKIITDEDLGTTDMAVFYGIAALIVALLQYLDRGTLPDTSGAWVRVVCAFLSIAPALYFIGRGVVPLLLKQQRSEAAE